MFAGSRRSIFSDELQGFIELLFSEGNLRKHAQGLQGVRRLTRDFLQTGLCFIQRAGARLEFCIGKARR